MRESVPADETDALLLQQADAAEPELGFGDQVERVGRGRFAAAHEAEPVHPAAHRQRRVALRLVLDDTDVEAEGRQRPGDRAGGGKMRLAPLEGAPGGDVGVAGVEWLVGDQLDQNQLAARADGLRERGQDGRGRGGSQASRAIAWW